MRRASTALMAAAFLGACAPGGPAVNEGPTPPPTVTVSGTGAEITLARETAINEMIIDEPIADVWRVLPNAWQDAMVPIARVNNATRTLQSGSFRAPSKIVGKPLSDYFDCGYTMAGPRVTLWQVMLDITGMVRPDSAGARVVTRIDALARPRDGTSTSPVSCSSRGELERIITGNVRVRLGR